MIPDPMIPDPMILDPMIPFSGPLALSTTDRAFLAFRIVLLGALVAAVTVASPPALHQS